MTTILKEMGVQQWRLRQANNEPVADVKAEPDVQTEIAQNQGSSPQADPKEARTDYSDIVSRGQSIEPSAEVTFAEVRQSIVSPAPAPAPVAMPSASLITAEVAKAPNDAIETLDWQGLQSTVDGQRQCPTCGSANSSLGAGDANADWLFVSDAPSRVDLAQHQLFSGRAGQLYEAMLLAAGLDRGSVYTTSVFKCVASEDLSVVPNCDKLLHRQIELVKPKVIVAFGEFAAQSIAKSNEDLEQLRTQNLMCHRTKIPIIVSYSPAQLLEEPTLKAGAWSDLKKGIAIAR